MGIIAWIILGLLAGVIAKALLPGDDPGGLIITTLIGVAGAFIGGLIVKALPHSLLRPTRRRESRLQTGVKRRAALLVSPRSSNMTCVTVALGTALRRGELLALAGATWNSSTAASTCERRSSGAASRRPSRVPPEDARARPAHSRHAWRAACAALG
jgi:uncharacterized membrane protein YeaQ/YmgE (transglycosylase-associated protein family)